jgi:molecular chaperone GrpE
LANERDLHDEPPRKPLRVRLSEVHAKLADEEAKAKGYLTRLQYLQAEFANYKKRIAREIADAAQYGNQRLVSELLPILDELDHAVNTSTTDGAALLTGVELILRKLYDVLHNEGLTEIPALGTSFDPHDHDAVETVRTDKFKAGTVVEVVRKGFRLKDKVIRPTLVKVASNPVDDTGE